MRFMVMIKANRDTEAGVMPSEDILAAMGHYNEELANAGVLLGGEGLHPSSRGARVRFSDGQPSVVDGPFAETRELIAGLLAIPDALTAGRHRVGEALPIVGRRRFGHRNPPNIRSRRLRCRVHP